MQDAGIAGCLRPNSCTGDAEAAEGTSCSSADSREKEEGPSQTIKGDNTNPSPALGAEGGDAALVLPPEAMEAEVDEAGSFSTQGEREEDGAANTEPHAGTRSTDPTPSRRKSGNPTIVSDELVRGPCLPLRSTRGGMTPKTPRGEGEGGRKKRKASPIPPSTSSSDEVMDGEIDVTTISDRDDVVLVSSDDDERAGGGEKISPTEERRTTRKVLPWENPGRSRLGQLPGRSGSQSQGLRPVMGTKEDGPKPMEYI